MKLSVELSGLWNNVRRMGAKPVEMDLDYEWKDVDLELDTLLSSSGIEIDLTSVEAEEGLLNYRGRQVLLYIPDQSYRIDAVLEKPSSGSKFHIAECSKLEEMRASNRFERYKVTNNIEGVFDVFGTNRSKKVVEGKAKLNVCRLCLNKLNYKNAANETVEGRNHIVEDFALDEFFTTYSSMFKYFPKTNVKDAKRGYSKDWDKISRRVRRDAQYCCSHCKVDLKTSKHLLHTHHLNSEKSDNRSENLIPLCADCHRKQPFHEHMQVKHKDISRINQLRREQGLLEIKDWQKVFQYSDPAFHGALLHSQSNGYSVPEVAFETGDLKNGEKVAVELAWPHKKTAMVVDKKMELQGWRLFGLEDATEFFGRDLTSKNKR